MAGVTKQLWQICKQYFSEKKYSLITWNILSLTN